MGANGYASVGSGTTGGGSASPVTVTNADDLKAAAKASGAKAIVFKGTIDVGDEVQVTSDKTIQGQDANTTVLGGFSMSDVSNIIIQHLNIKANGAVDTISSRRSKNIWYDHLNIYDAGDGLLNESDLQTVSWCKFWYSSKSSDHRLASLVGFGGGDHPEDDEKLRVTYHDNRWSQNVDQRMPRVMYGDGHIYNNYYDSTGNSYCIGFGSYASILIQNNYFKKVKNPHQFMYDVYAYDEASGNIYDGTSGTKDTGKKGSKHASGQENLKYDPVKPPYSFSLDTASGIPDLVQRCAGPHSSPAGGSN